ncbi:MAG: prepilin-type N-terminal cleavage/methylation domain-containing protein [Candidatus Aureabacteria bacterium]|nr:prepilin-type N-terminal cleavage/methylation domain-containing protein [Candidatus Auribacterota bacterium]
MKKQKGFTLIELLVLIIILSIVMTISTPRFSSTYKSLRTRSEAKKLVEYIRFARSKAVQNQITYKIIYKDDNSMEIVELENERLSRYAIDPAVTVSMDPASIDFYPNGMMSAFIILLDDSAGSRYQISATSNDSSISISKILLHEDI